jgi:hypothetical protein
MNHPRTPSVAAVALYANAALLFGILIVLLGRGRGMDAPALADVPLQVPIAGGNGVFVMPCQLHPNVWGCFLVDVQHGTMCVYEYRSGDKALVLTAARDYEYDLRLRNYDTFPPDYDVKKLMEDQDNGKQTQSGNDSSPSDGK